MCVGESGSDLLRVVQMRQWDWEYSNLGVELAASCVELRWLEMPPLVS